MEIEIQTFSWLSCSYTVHIDPGCYEKLQQFSFSRLIWLSSVTMPWPYLTKSLIILLSPLTSVFYSYRVSHETWQLMNSLECHLPNTGLDSKTFLQFSSVEKSFTPIYRWWDRFCCNKTVIMLIILFDIKQLNTLRKKTF